MKIINIPQFTFLYVVLLLQIADAQSLGLPSRAQLEARARERGSLSNGPKTDGIVYNETDFDLPAEGRLMTADVKRLARMHQDLKHLLEITPTTEAGTGSSRFAAILSWNNELSRCVSTGKSADLLTVLPTLLAFVERDTESELQCLQLQKAESRMTHAGFFLVRALAHHFTHLSGSADPDLLRSAVKLFCNGKLVDETSWDVDDPMPIDSAGIFILNPELATAVLKTRPVEGVRFFLTNVSEPGVFFRRYEGDGPGIAKIKTHYEANKAVIESKHREMVTWLSEQEQEQEQE